MASIVNGENEVAKCTFCNEFYGYYLFDNLCSECLFKNNSEKYLELFSKKYLGPHTQSYLYNYVFKNKIPSNSIFYNSLKNMFYSGTILEKGLLKSWLNHVKNNSNYLGISVNQAIELTNTYLVSPSLNLDKETKCDLQHIVGGLILDHWNIDKNSGKLGSASCYYFSEKNQLKYGTSIEPSAAFSNLTSGEYQQWLKFSRLNSKYA